MFVGMQTAQAVNGEQAGGRGYYTPSACDRDYQVLCDDRNGDDGIPSCHMRSASGMVDEGLGFAICSPNIDLVSPGESIHKNVTASNFTDLNCYQRYDMSGETPVLVNSCIVCATYVDGAGMEQCIRIDSGLGTGTAGAHGPFTIDVDDSACLQAEDQASNVFSHPQVGWFVSETLDDVGDTGSKHVTLCADRSWAALPPRPVETLQPDAFNVRGVSGFVTIDTPGCYKKRDGKRICF